MAHTKRKRTRLARNIYSDQFGVAVVVARGGARDEQRFPLGTPLEELAATRDTMIDDLETGRATKAHRRGTLAADVQAALATIPDGRHRRDTATLLAHWMAAEVETEHEPTTFGALPRGAITALQVRTQLATFQSVQRDGRRRFSAKTVKELRRVLAWVYTTLDGAEGRNPVRGVKAPRVQYDDPRGIDYGAIERVFAEMPDRGRPQDGEEGGSTRGKRRRPVVNLSKLRMRVMAYTGLHQIEVGRLEPRDVDLVAGRVWIGARVKGAGAPGAWHRLTRRGVEALRAFVAAEAFGPFDPRSMARTWTIALRKAEATWKAAAATRDQPWPVRADARPYDLRHSLGTAVYLETGDLRAAQAILRHRQLSTTDRYTRAGVPKRVDAAVAALDAAFGALPQTAATEPGKSGRNSPPIAAASDPASASGKAD